MPALTKPLEIGAAWTEVTAGLGMADGSSYVVEVQDARGTGNGHVVAVDTDDAVAPDANARGHEYYPRTAAGGPTLRTFVKVAGRRWWMRSVHGETMYVVATVV